MTLLITKYKDENCIERVHVNEKQHFINALKFAQGRFQSTMETNIFIEILRVYFE